MERGDGITTTFVLDTNVLMTSQGAIAALALRGNVAIPARVLSELDDNKDKFGARAALRELEAIFEGRWTSRVQQGNGTVFIESRCFDLAWTGQQLSSSSRQAADTQILGTALEIRYTHRDQQTVVVSNDRWVRWGASKLGLQSQSWHPPKVELGHRVIVHGEYAVNKLREGERVRVPSKIGTLYPNQPVLVQTPCESSRILGFADASGENILPLMRSAYEGVFGIVPMDDTQRFALHALLSPEIPVVTIAGKAGSGKTLLALAAAKLFWQEKGYKVLVTRPEVSAGERSGFLPGKLTAKMAPWLQGVRDNLQVIDEASPDRVASWNGSPHSQRARTGQKDALPEWLDSLSLGYERGASHRRTILIVDEAQNLKRAEAKTLVSRIGEDAKIILLGDPDQSDLEGYDGLTGLLYVATRFIQESVAAHVLLTKTHRSRAAERAADLL